MQELMKEEWEKEAGTVLDGSHLLKKLQSIHVVVVGEVDDAVQLVLFDVGQGGVALVRPTVLHIREILITHEVAIHESRLP